MAEDWTAQLTKKVSAQVLKGLDIDPAVIAKQMTPIIKKQIETQAKQIVIDRIGYMLRSAIAEVLESRRVHTVLAKHLENELVKTFK